MPDCLKKLFDMLDNPQHSLQRSYDTKEREVVETRQELAKSLAREKHLEKQLEKNR